MQNLCSSFRNIVMKRNSDTEEATLMKNFLKFIICLVDIGIQKSWAFSISDSFTLLHISYRKKIAQYKGLLCHLNCSFWWSDTKIKVISFAKDLFLHFYQRFSSTNNAPTLTLISFNIWYAIEIGISPNKSLPISFQKIIRKKISKLVEKIIQIIMLSTVKNDVLVPKKHTTI